MLSSVTRMSPSTSIITKGDNNMNGYFLPTLVCSLGHIAIPMRCATINASVEAMKENIQHRRHMTRRSIRLKTWIWSHYETQSCLHITVSVTISAPQSEATVSCYICGACNDDFKSSEAQQVSGCSSCKKHKLWGGKVYFPLSLVFNGN